MRHERVARTHRSAHRDALAGVEAAPHRVGKVGRQHAPAEEARRIGRRRLEVGVSRVDEAGVGLAAGLGEDEHLRLDHLELGGVHLCGIEANRKQRALSQE